MYDACIFSWIKILICNADMVLRKEHWINKLNKFVKIDISFSLFI